MPGQRGTRSYERMIPAFSEQACAKRNKIWKPPALRHASRAGRSSPRRRKPATRIATCSARPRVSLCAGPQLHAARCAAGEISQPARHARLRARRAGAGQRARPRQFRDARRAGAASGPAARRRGRRPRHAGGRTCARWHTLGVRGLRFNHFFRDGQLHYRGGVPLEAARILAPVDEGARLAPAALDRREGSARHDPDPEGDRPAGGDRPHGPHRRAGRHPAPGFQALLRLLGEGGCWVKLSGAHRVSRRRRTIRTRARFTRRWSRQIPSSSCGAPTGRIRAWKARCRTPGTCSTCSTSGRADDAIRRRILVDNPARLYEFPRVVTPATAGRCTRLRSGS